MALTTRRQFVQQTALVAVALHRSRFPSFLQDTPGESSKELAPVDAAALRKLVSQIDGHVITPEASDYESARLVFNRGFDRRPAVIVRCAGPSDVARTLDFAQTKKLPLAVRAGGHSRLGYGMCDGGVVIDLSGMKRVEADPNKHLARAEAGALVRDLDEATQRFGLATTSGGCPTVGIAGFTLGGRRRSLNGQVWCRL
jgi:FAD/FMN-containing dehydrogenase